MTHPAQFLYQNVFFSQRLFQLSCRLQHCIFHGIAGTQCRVHPRNQIPEAVVQLLFPSLNPVFPIRVKTYDSNRNHSNACPPRPVTEQVHSGGNPKTDSRYFEIFPTGKFPGLIVDPFRLLLLCHARLCLASRTYSHPVFPSSFSLCTSSPVFCRPLPYSLRNKETVLISSSSIPVISAISSTRRLPSSPRPKCTRISIPDAIWRRIASNGSCTPISTIVSRREIISFTLFACAVLKDPACPVLSAFIWTPYVPIMQKYNIFT